MIVETGMKVGKPAEGKPVLSLLLNNAHANTNGHCKGVMYWEPEAPSGYNGGYDMGAFSANSQKQCTPTAIMEAFTDFALENAIAFPSANPQDEKSMSRYDLLGKRLPSNASAQKFGIIVTQGGKKLHTL